MPAETTTLPLSQLYLHELNPRQTVTESEIEEMATSLAMHGLIQNLAGLRQGRAKKAGIVAGGRRLRALQLLAERGEPLGGATDWQDAIPVRLTDDPDEALRWAGAENEARATLHPADEVRLYRGLEGKGLTPAAIARAHAVTELHVRRRLALAHLPDPVIDALKAGEITLDIARAFTISDDEAAILALLDAVRGRDVTARSVRHDLTRGSVPASDRRARFVGLDAYAEAGGALSRDLFEGQDVLHDADLLDRLFADRLEAESDRIEEKEGWAEVRICPDPYLSYDETSKLTRIWPEPVTLPEADEAELERLAEMEDDSLTAEEAARLRELSVRAEGDFTDDQRETGIVFVYVDHAGRLQVTRAYTTRAATPAREATGDTALPAPEAKGLSAALISDLDAIRTAALQAALTDAENRDLVFAIAAHESDGVKPWHRVMGLSLHEPPLPDPETEALTLPKAVTETRLDGAEASAAQIEAMLAGDIDGWLDQLQVTLARAVQARPDAYGAAIEALADVDIRAHWRPTAVNFLSRCPGPYLDRVHATLRPDAEAAAFAGLKKAEKVRILDEIFTLSPEAVKAHALTEEEQDRVATWLPAEMTRGREIGDERQEAAE